MAGEPRVELDMPTLIVTQNGAMEADNEKTLERLLSPFFQAGDVVSLHIVAEFTGQRRKFCKFECNQWNGRYKHTCNKTMDSNGICPEQESHIEEQDEHDKQVALESQSEESN